MDAELDNKKIDTQISKTDSVEEEAVKPEVITAAKVIEPKFKVISIDKTEAPRGMTGSNWYRYIIGQGTSKIEGLTMGDLQKVTQHAQAIAFDLNDRSKGGSSSHKTNKSKVTPPKPPAPALET